MASGRYAIDTSDGTNRSSIMPTAIRPNTLDRPTREAVRAAAIGSSPRSWKSGGRRSEEHTSELQSLMRNSYAVFCLKKKKHNRIQAPTTHQHTEKHYATSRKEKDTH